MVNKEYIEKLKELKLEDIINIDNYIKNYISWNYLGNEFKEKLEYVGQIVPKKKLEYEYPSEENYWSLNAPISFNHYPYFGCKLYKYKEHEIYFLIYKDFGGNIPEERCRLLQKKLIVK